MDENGWLFFLSSQTGLYTPPEDQLGFNEHVIATSIEDPTLSDSSYIQLGCS
jgi:hypothetical protein